MNETIKTVTRTELYEAVWSKTLQALAKEWNTTYLRIVQACEEMNIPRPSHGHWQAIACGNIIESEPLPPPTETIPQQVVLLPQEVRPVKQSTESNPPKASPPPEPERKMATPEPPKEKESEMDLTRTTEQAVLDVLRQARSIDFWASAISETVDPSQLTSWLKLGKEVNVSAGRLLQMLKKARKEYRSFQVAIQDAKDRFNEAKLIISVQISLRDGFEWKDAWEEAWTFADQPNALCLSDNALRLYVWAKGPKNTGRKMKWQKVGAQARLSKTYSHT